MKSGKTDDERKSYIMAAIRQSNKKSWYEGRYESMQTFEDRMKLHAKYDKFCEGLYDIWLDQYSEGDFYKMIFNILLRENQCSRLINFG